MNSETHPAPGLSRQGQQRRQEILQQLLTQLPGTARRRQRRKRAAQAAGLTLVSVALGWTNWHVLQQPVTKPRTPLVTLGEPATSPPPIHRPTATSTAREKTHPLPPQRPQPGHYTDWLAKNQPGIAARYVVSSQDIQQHSHLLIELLGDESLQACLHEAGQPFFVAKVQDQLLLWQSAETVATN